MPRRMQILYDGKPCGDWERFPGGVVAKHARYVLRVGGDPAFPGSGVPIVWVLHCGHPTANYPYYLVPTDSPHLDAMRAAIMGAAHQTFGRLIDAKLLAEQLASRIGAEVGRVSKQAPVADHGQGDLFEV